MALNPTPSLLDHQQILQRVFDKDNDALRTDATIQVDTINADLTVDIKAASGDDISIASQDGTKHLFINSDGSINTNSALPANAAQESGGHLASIDSHIPANLTVTSTRLLVDGSGVTQPISGSITANAGTGTFAISAASLPLPIGAATSANQTTQINQISASTSSITSVSSSTSSVSLLVSNSSRKAAYFFNESTSVVYLKLGTTASSTSYTLQMLPNSFATIDEWPVYTGAVDAIWVTASGAMRITELT